MLYNEILQGRQQNLLTRFWAMVGGSPAPQLAPEVQPSWALDNVDHDTAVLQGVRWCMASGLAVIVAAQYPRVGLRNGSGTIPIPNSLVVIKRVYFYATVATVVFFNRVSPPAGAVQTTKRHQDYRVNPNDPLAFPPHDLTAFSSAVAPSSTDAFARFACPANTTVSVDTHIVLPPTAGGSYFEVLNTLIASDLVATFEYYYREMTPAELVF